jgi:ABC-2 type transport system ATP-binding protein
MHQNSENVIEVRDLTKTFRRTEAVRGISFEVKRGEIFGILGPNGAGKTTTLEIIEGLKHQTSGECFVLGLDNRTHVEEIKSKIGVQLQSSEYLNNLTIAELVKLFGSIYKVKVDPLEALKLVDLEEKKNSFVKELSGGQKQRFTIATALVHNPKILFLDEPTTGLDPQARRDMWELIKDLNKSGITIVLTTHYMEEAEYLCTRVAIMERGKILQIDPPQKLIDKNAQYYKLSFLTDQKVTKEIFYNIPEVINVQSHSAKTIIDLEYAEILPDVLKVLKQNNIQYHYLNLQTASLEDVYLKLTGHEYSQ